MSRQLVLATAVLFAGFFAGLLKLLVDAGKFGQQALSRLCALGEIDTVVADAALSRSHQRKVREAGCELIIAE